MRLSQAVSGSLFFAGLWGIVCFLDSIIFKVFLSNRDPENSKVTLRHFSWYISDFFSKEGFTSFINAICENKPGILSNSSFYIALISGFICLTVFFYFYFLTKDSTDAARLGHLKNKCLLVPGPAQNRILFFLFIWLLVKQIVFIFFIPPWQGPDEPYHYLVSASYDSELDELYSKTLKSTDTFKFMKYSERRYKDHVPVWHSIEDMRQYQPPLYYILNGFLGKVTGVTHLPNAVYLGRLISTFSLILTILMVYVIALLVFEGPQKMVLSKLCAVFVAAHPQVSYVGATMGPDAMVNMFITGALLFLLLAVKTDSRRKTAMFFLTALLFSLLAMFTKRIGFSLVPVLLFGCLQVCNFRFSINLRKGALPAVISLSLIIGMAFLYILFSHFELNSIISHRVFDYSVEAMKSGWSNLWDQRSLKVLSILFVSFCLTFGWMVFKVSLGTY
ncbi:MAG: ArnT family glycosyltransferase, partial [Nitrospinota bacterium]